MLCWREGSGWQALPFLATCRCLALPVCVLACAGQASACLRLVSLASRLVFSSTFSPSCLRTASTATRHRSFASPSSFCSFLCPLFPLPLTGASGDGTTASKCWLTFTRSQVEATRTTLCCSAAETAVSSENNSTLISKPPQLHQEAHALRALDQTSPDEGASRLC